MSTRRMSSAEILALLEAPSDDLPVRRINTWTLEKLAIVSLYQHAFTAASQSARGGVYVDGFAGPGLCRVRGAIAPPEFVWGSPMLGMTAKPGFQQCHFIELDKRAAEALESRTGRFGQRGNVVRDDVNHALPEMMRDAVDLRAPCFCLLDPEGTELNWRTVESTALTAGRKRKPELLILFPSSWLLRLLPRKGRMDPRHEQILDRMLPTASWRDVYQQRLAGEIEPGEAKNRYVEIYRQGLEDLGYIAFSHPVEAPTRPGERRRERYQLVFATEHEAGQRIMTDVFRRPYVLDFPVSAQPMLFEDA